MRKRRKGTVPAARKAQNQCGAQSPGRWPATLREHVKLESECAIAGLTLAGGPRRTARGFHYYRETGVLFSFPFLSFPLLYALVLRSPTPPVQMAWMKMRMMNLTLSKVIEWRSTSTVGRGCSVTASTLLHSPPTPAVGDERAASKQRPDSAFPTK